MQRQKKNNEIYHVLEKICIYIQIPALVMGIQTITGTRNVVNRVIPIKPGYPGIKSTTSNVPPRYSGSIS
jgi:hypothetical protein